MSLRAEIATLLRSGNWEEAIEYLDKGITHAHNIIDVMQSTVRTYEDIRSQILEVVEEQGLRGQA